MVNGAFSKVRLSDAGGRDLGIAPLRPNYYNTGKMHFAQTPNTIVSCRVCMGTRFIGHRTADSPRVSLNPCPHCAKSGVMKWI